MCLNNFYAVGRKSGEKIFLKVYCNFASLKCEVFYEILISYNAKVSSYQSLFIARAVLYQIGDCPITGQRVT